MDKQLMKEILPEVRVKTKGINIQKIKRNVIKGGVIVMTLVIIAIWLFRTMDTNVVGALVHDITIKYHQNQMSKNLLEETMKSVPGVVMVLSIVNAVMNIAMGRKINIMPFEDHKKHSGEQQKKNKTKGGRKKFKGQNKKRHKYKGKKAKSQVSHRKKNQRKRITNLGTRTKKRNK